MAEQKRSGGFCRTNMKNNNLKVSVADTPKVAVLLCTMHAQEFLEEQLDSIERQTHSNWKIYVSDDGSQDRTHDILRLFAERVGAEKVLIHSGPAQGFARNFLFLTGEAGESADYYAYADQDDIWEEDKLARALNWLGGLPPNVPALYCSRTCLVNKNGEFIGYSPLFRKSPSFANALVQNIGGGNTMVFNEAARSLLKKIGDDVNVAAHDWWAYMVVSGCGGHVLYDPYPTVRYRQHGSNQIGASIGWLARMRRLKLLWGGRFRVWNDINIAALQQIRSELTEGNREVLDRFCEARGRSLFWRMVGLKRAGVYRQTLVGNISLLAAALMRKL